METVITLFFTVACILFILSFFKKEQNTELERQIENVSLTLMQELYQVKKKVQILEEEFMIGDESNYQAPTIQEEDEERIIELYEEDHPLQEIAKLTNFDSEAVEDVITAYIRTGKRKEFQV